MVYLTLDFGKTMSDNNITVVPSIIEICTVEVIHLSLPESISGPRGRRTGKKTP